jgi:peptidoglycan hydrolase-like protein with peptidoglycan-binding domain
MIYRMPKDIIRDWVEFRPDKILDKRDVMPKHKTMRWKKRKISSIQGMCFHHTAGSRIALKTAANHVDSFKGVGAPGLCYTFFIEEDGVIWWANDIESVVWSQGYSKRPGSENVDFISCVVGGDFSSPGYKGADSPSVEQVISMLQLSRWLSFHLNFKYSDVYGHFNFGKDRCPGQALENIIVDVINKDGSLGVEVKLSSHDYQWALHRLGYDIGEFGNGNGVDGIFGHMSRLALSKFQKDVGLPFDGYMDSKTSSILVRELKIRFGDDVSIHWDGV